MARKKLTVYQRLVRAAKAGKCLRLCANDVWQLGRMDEAITSRADQDDEEDSFSAMEAREFAKKLLSGESDAEGPKP